MEQAHVTKISKDTYRFTETGMGTDVYTYLLIGTEKALLIDTAYGFTDVPSAIRNITDLPLIVVNTHGHMDHMHGNHLYEQVYLAQADQEVFSRHNDPRYLMELMGEVARENHLPANALELPHLRIKDVVRCTPSVPLPLPEEMLFELGNRRVTILNTPGHTVGSITLLDEKNRWAFSGDTTCRDGVLLHFPESTSVEIFRESILKLKQLVCESKIVSFFPSHQQTPLGVEILDLYIRNCDQVLNEQLDTKSLEQGRYTCNRCTIRFDPNHIWEE